MQKLDLQPVESKSKKLDLVPLDIQPISTEPSADDILAEAKKSLISNALPTEPVKEEVKPEKKGLLGSIWDKVSAPLTDAPSRFANKISEYIDPDHSSSGARAVTSAFIESLGNTVSGLSSPLNLALTATGVTEGMAAARGLTGVAKAMNYGTKAMSVPVAIEGAHNLVTGETLPDKLMGGLELAGGLHGLRNRMPSIAESVKTNEIPSSPINLDQKVNTPEPSFAESVLDDSGRPIAPVESNSINLRPEGPWGENGSTIQDRRIPYDPYQSVLEKQGRGELRRRASDVPPQKSAMASIRDTDIPIDEVKPRADFAFHQPDFEGGSIPMYNVDAEGHPLHRSSVTADTLRENGIEVPDTPEFDPNVRPQKPLTLEEREALTKPKQLDIQPVEEIDPTTGEIRESTIEQPVSMVNDSPMFNRKGQTGETGSIQANKPILPKDLQGAKPRFNFGTDTYHPKFENDLDKALYIIAQKTPSKRNADYLKFAMEHTGLDEKAVMQAAIDLRGKIKEIIKKSKPGDVNIPSLYTEPKVVSSTRISSKSITPVATPEGALKIPKGQATPAAVKDAVAEGYKFKNVDEEGNFVFEKSNKPTNAPILETEVNNTSGRQKLGPDADTRKESKIAEAMNFPRTVMASMDMSAPLRQGIGLIHKKEFWNSFDDMFKAWGSETGFNAVQKSIADKPLFKQRASSTSSTGYKPSFAQEAGLKLTDLHDLSTREEALMSSWAEKVPGVRRSNRAYTAFINKLRADTFESLIKQGKIFGINTEGNVPLARELANFVNTATGRGSLGKLEQSAVALNSAFFAPRLIASRLKMLNPNYYIMASPMVRKEAIKSLLAVAGTGMMVGQLGKMAGGTVEKDPTSSDFGKVKIGSIRVDPFAGFQQYIVAANRLLQGRTKSSTTGHEYNLGEKFGRQTRLDVAGRFAESKLNPTLSFAVGMLRGKDFTGQPFNVPEEVASRFIPIFLQDLKQLATEDPNLIPGIHDDNPYKEFHPKNLAVAPLSFFGMGVQQYGSK